MTKLLLILSIALVGAQAQSQEITADGNILLRNGKTTVQIRIGDKAPNNKQLVRRVRSLERAVHDLQETVYELQLNDTPMMTEYTCRLQNSWNTYVAKGAGSTLKVAENNAREAVMANCRAKETFASNCTDSKIQKCYQSL